MIACLLGVGLVAIGARGAGLSSNSISNGGACSSDSVPFGSCISSAKLQQSGSAAREVDVATMLQAKVALEPDDRADQSRSRSADPRQDGNNAEEASQGLSMDKLLHLVEQQLQNTAEGTSRASVLDLIRDEIMEQNDGEILDDDKIENAIENATIAISAPAPPPAGPAQSSLDSAGLSSAVTWGNFSFDLGPADVNTPPTPAPPPYSGVSIQSVPVLLPNPVLSPAEQKTMHAARAQAMLNCVVDAWSDWTTCQEIQGALLHSPFQQRVRPVVQQPSAGGLPCPMPLDESRACVESDLNNPFA